VQGDRKALQFLSSKLTHIQCEGAGRPQSPAKHLIKLTDTYTQAIITNLFQ